MIVQVRYELVSADLAIALALRAEEVHGSAEDAQNFIDGTGKAEVRSIARQRLLRDGDPEYWGAPNEEDLMTYAREHANKLWPEGA